MKQTSLITSLVTLIGTIAIPLIANAADQIIEAQGRVSVQHDGASQYQRVGVGTVLRQGDLIRPEPRVKVIVRCNDNTLWRVPSGVPSGLETGCPNTVARFNTRGRGQCDFLAFLNHRCVYSTAVLTAQPRLRWNSVAGATHYQVQVTSGSETIWEQTVERTEIRYAGTDLQPGMNYQLVVMSVDNQENEAISRLSLQRLDEERAKMVQDAIAQIKSQDLSREGEALALANVYQEAGQQAGAGSNKPGLVLDAIAALEPLVASGNHTPYVHRLLGDLYLQVGLIESAAARYQEAANLAQQDSDQQNEASAEVGLANTALAKGDRIQAEQWLKLAKQNYLALGDTEQTKLVDEWINKLNL